MVEAWTECLGSDQTYGWGPRTAPTTGEQWRETGCPAGASRLERDQVRVLEKKAVRPVVLDPDVEAVREGRLSLAQS